MRFVILYKIMPNHCMRYYSLGLNATLFGEFVVERIYGNVRFKSFTGKKMDCFTSYQEAKDFFEMVKSKKMKRGYMLDLNRVGKLIV